MHNALLVMMHSPLPKTYILTQHYRCKMRNMKRGTQCGLHSKNNRLPCWSEYAYVVKLGKLLNQNLIIKAVKNDMNNTSD